jgi:hypothetical protein
MAKYARSIVRCKLQSVFANTHPERAAHLPGVNRNTLRKKIREPGIRGRSAMKGKRGARKRKSSLAFFVASILPVVS